MIAATELIVWEIKGPVSTSLLQEAKLLPGVAQAALFGNRIHISGRDRARITQALDQLASRYPVTWQEIPVTLEDAFTHLVKHTT